MSANLPRIYYDKSVPCWICSKSLQQLPKNPSLLSRENKKHAGQYIGFMFFGHDGLEHTGHITCIERERLNDYHESLDDKERQNEQKTRLPL